jgi:hypothetical protein
MTKEEILEMLFECETEEDLIKVDTQITIIKELGDIQTSHYLWNQLFMVEEGIIRSKH